MSIQPKNRKDSRRFTKLMSLVLSASLVFGNVAIAYANPNDADQLDIIDDYVEAQAGEGSEGTVSGISIVSQDVAVSFGDVETLKVSINEGTESVSAAALIKDKAGEKKSVIISDNLAVSSTDLGKVKVSFNQIENISTLSVGDTCKVSANVTIEDTVSAGGVSFCGTSANASTNVEVEIVSASETPTPTPPEPEGPIINPDGSISINKGVEVSVNVKPDTASTNSTNAADIKKALDTLKVDEVKISANTLSAADLALSTNKVNVTLVVNETKGVKKDSEKNVDAIVSINGSVELKDSVSYSGIKTVEGVATITLNEKEPEKPVVNPDGSISINKGVAVSVNVKPETASVNSTNATAVKAALDTLKVDEVKISGNTLSAADLALSTNKVNVTLVVNETKGIKKDSSKNVDAIVSINGSVELKDSVSYSGIKTVEGVATITLNEKEPEKPVVNPDGSISINKGVAVSVNVKPETASVNSTNATAVKAALDTLKVDEVKISGNTLSAGDLALSTNKVKVTLVVNETKGVKADSAKNVDAIVSINGSVKLGSVSYSGIKTVEGVATIKLDENASTSDNATDIKDVAVTVTGSPASSTVASQAAAKAKADSLKPSKVTVSGVALTADQLKNVTVKFAVGTVTTTSKDNVTATVTINKPIEVKGVTYTGTKTVTKAATIKLAPASQSIKLNKAADKAISFKEGKKGSKTIAIKNVKTSLKVTVTKADQKKIKATVQKGNKIKIDSKKKAGTATVKIQAISNTNYKASNTLTVKVTIVPKKQATGKAANVKVVSKTKKVAKVTWKKPAKGKNINGYEVQYASSKKALKNGKSIIVKGAKKKSVTIKKLASKKKVYVRVRPVYIKNGATNPSKSWSAVKNCKVK